MTLAGVDNVIGFTSYTYDKVLDLYFAQARFYDQNDRRFISVDPIKDGVNWYAYCGNSPTVFVDPSGLAAVSIINYTNKHGGTVSWSGKTGVVTFEISGIKLTTSESGLNCHGIKIQNRNNRLVADDKELDLFFGQALTWDQSKASNTDGILKSGFSLALGAALVDSPMPGPGDAVGIAIAVGTGLVVGGIMIYESATQNSSRGKYGEQTVQDVLKSRKGSIKNAPIPPGGPSWEMLLPMTMDAIRRLADQGETGYKTIWKLLNDSRFYK